MPGGFMKEEPIDLNKLTQRELLIMLHSDVKELKENQKEARKEHQVMELKLNTLETKAKVWGGFTGFLAAIGTVIFERFIR
ncbi:MAG: hypothetical protein HOP30_21750 [Cyclobacteriaceae bacterium]|nr:hypothetical protein [Cyclobacteriaceae bacterium]